MVSERALILHICIPCGKTFFCGTEVKAKYQLEGGHLDFSHLTEFKKLYIAEIYMKKQYKSSIIKNHRITEKKMMVFP